MVHTTVSLCCLFLVLKVREASTYVKNTVNKIYFNAAVIALPSKQVDRRARPL